MIKLFIIFGEARMKWSFLILLALVLTSCATPTVQTIEVTRIVQQTVVVTQLQTVVVTATPLPATATPTITPTFTITPTPVFAKWSADQIVSAFKQAGLEAENTRSMTKDDYGLAPMMANQGIRFIIPSLCADCGGKNPCIQ